MKTILSTNMNIDKLSTKYASLLPLRQQVRISFVSLNIKTNLEATQV